MTEEHYALLGTVLIVVGVSLQSGIANAAIAGGVCLMAIAGYLRVTR